MRKNLKYLFLLLLIAFPIFGHLDVLPIRIWDEARQATNAIEMLKNGNWLVTYFEGQPDMWSVKPPLLIWLQAIALKIFGQNEIAIRLPSAIATFLICMFLLRIGQRYLKDFWFGFITVLIFVTAQGFIGFHVSRTGDYDALLSLFNTLMIFFFYDYLNTKNKKYFYLSSLSLIGACLTKGIAGLMMLPALLIYFLIQKKDPKLLFNKHLLANLLLFLLFVPGFYLLREQYNPGYIETVWQNELGGRFLQVTENHSGGFLFYARLFLEYRFWPWVLFLPIGIIVSLFSKDKVWKSLSVFCIVNASWFFFVISFSKTKLKWYDAPLYPFFAILTAFGIYAIFLKLRNVKLNPEHKDWLVKLLPYFFLFIVFLQPFTNILNNTYKPKELSNEARDYYTSYLLRDALKGKIQIDDQVLLHHGYAAHLKFYMNQLEGKNKKIGFKNHNDLQKGDKVMVYQKMIKDYLNENHETELISQRDSVSFYLIK